MAHEQGGALLIGEGHDRAQDQTDFVHDLEIVNSFLSSQIPEECSKSGDKFDQEHLDVWVGEAFSVKDSLTRLINEGAVTAEEALDLAESWDNKLLGRGEGERTGLPIPWSVINGDKHPIDVVRKPTYRYTYVDYHNRNSQPKAEHEGYLTEGLRLGYQEDFRDLLPGVKSGRIIGLIYDSNVPLVGMLQEDAEVVVEAGVLKFRLPVTRLITGYGCPEEENWTEYPDNILTEAATNPRYYNTVWSRLLNNRSGYKKRPSEDVANLLIEFRDRWQTSGNEVLEGKIYDYLQQLVEVRSAEEEKRVTVEASRRGSWVKAQEELIAALNAHYE